MGQGSYWQLLAIMRSDPHCFSCALAENLQFGIGLGFSLSGLGGL